MIDCNTYSYGLSNFYIRGNSYHTLQLGIYCYTGCFMKNQNTFGGDRLSNFKAITLYKSFP